MIKKYLLLFTIILVLQSANSIHGAKLPPGFVETRIASGLDPTSMAILPDGRILIANKTGTILLVKNNVVQNKLFFRINNVDNFNERGLLNLILDPDFENNNFIYVYYTYRQMNATSGNNRISRFTVSGDSVNPTSELVLFDFDLLYTVGVHNGGGLLFGNDGKLYASSGENANGVNAQDIKNTFGKVIRINVNGTIPMDNPFYNTAVGANRAIYAMGLRNPFKMKLQSSTGKIFVNDVGGSEWEEINELKAGGNYGWPMVEGKITNQNPPAFYIDPVFAYNHNNGACSITGGTFYNPTQPDFPATYIGKYFYLDYCAGWIKYIDPADNFKSTDFVSEIDRGIDLQIDEKGNMYYLARGGIGGGSDQDNTSSTDGELWMISYTGLGDVSIGLQPENKKVAAGTPVTFTVSASGTGSIEYQWLRNGEVITGANASNYTIPYASLVENGDTFNVKVSNATSSILSSKALLTVINNTPPVGSILFPSVDSTYEAGTIIQFKGSARDAENGNLPASAFSWSVGFHHDEHVHPVMGATPGNLNGSFAIPDEGETSDTVWYRIHLTVTDSMGTKSTVYRDIFPKKVFITLNTLPSGLNVILDGKAISTPYTFKAVVGLKRTIEVPNAISRNDSSFVFGKWSDNETRLHTIITPQNNVRYIAEFKHQINTANDNSSKFNNSISIHPNPIQHNEILNVNLPTATEAINVFNMTGKMMFQTYTLNEDEFKIDTKTFLKGMYILQINTTNQNYFKSFIVE